MRFETGFARGGSPEAAIVVIPPVEASEERARRGPSRAVYGPKQTIGLSSGRSDRSRSVVSFNRLCSAPVLLWNTL